MKLRVYIDTSVLSALFDANLMERQVLTAEFWSRRGQYDLSTSEVCRHELEQVSHGELRRKLLGLLDDLTVISVTEEMNTLAERYVVEKAFSAAMLNDALHVAAAVIGRHEILLSWNFRHLVNRRRRAKVNAVNIETGLPSIEILAPPEV